jgi:hypothetical protein
MDRAVAQIATTMKKQTVPDDEYKKIRDEMLQQVEHIANPKMSNPTRTHWIQPAYKFR